VPEDAAVTRRFPDTGTEGIMHRLPSFILAAIVFASLPVVLVAQFTQSSIVGTVTDASGAPVSDAEVTVRNEGTNFVRTIRTESSGDYRVSGLEAGFYQVTVAVPGFKTF